MDATNASVLETALRQNAVSLMILLNLLAVGFTAWVLRRGGANTKVVLWGGAVLLAWLAILHVILSNRALVPTDVSGVTFLLIIFAGVGVFGAGIFLSPMRKELLSLDQHTLALAQGIRVFFGAGFLLHAAIGLLPLGFGIIDGFTHVSAGFLGLIASALIARNPQKVGPVLFANAFGLIDILIVASSIALILLPEMTPHHPMMYAVFLPAPIWLWFHVVSFLNLVRSSA